MSGKLYDSTGREIREGDLLRSPHFKARGRWNYLYHIAFVHTGTGKMRAAYAASVYEKGFTLHNSCGLSQKLTDDMTIICGHKGDPWGEDFYNRPRRGRA